jgi:glucosyl-3-phosphoglycerate phosphatase
VVLAEPCPLVVASCTIMNHLSRVVRLANRFSVMRHAQSKANARGIIVSRIENDRQSNYRLTEHGRQQALAAAQGCGLPGDTIIYSSDFSRERQTAEVVARIPWCAGGCHRRSPPRAVFRALGRVGDRQLRARLGCRRDHPGHTDGNVEPAAAVLDRATAFIAQLERRHCGRDILLVSHGDTLQVLQAGFSGVDPSRHRSVPHLATAEIRQLRLGQRNRRQLLSLRLAPGIASERTPSAGFFVMGCRQLCFPRATPPRGCNREAGHSRDRAVFSRRRRGGKRTPGGGPRVVWLAPGWCSCCPPPSARNPIG